MRRQGLAPSLRGGVRAGCCRARFCTSDFVYREAFSTLNCDVLSAGVPAKGGIVVFAAGSRFAGLSKPRPEYPSNPSERISSYLRAGKIKLPIQKPCQEKISPKWVYFSGIVEIVIH